MRKVKISDFAEVITGGTPSTSVSEYWDNGTIPWLQSGACQNCMITDCNTFITQAGLDSSAAKMMKPNSVLIALTGATTGKVGYLTFEACANQSVTGIQPNDNFIPKYLYYYLLGIRQKILDDSYGGAQKHISQGYVKNLEIPLGTINEQKGIADIFEHVDRIISLRQKEIAALDDLIKARFVEMFGDIKTNKYGWEKCTFQDVTTKITDGEHGTVPRVNRENGFLYFMARNITRGGLIDLSETSYVPEDVHNKIFKRCNPEYGDLLLVCVGATIGKCTLVPRDLGEFSMARSVALLKPNKEKVTSQFLINLLRSETIQTDIENCSHTAAQAGLYTNMICSLEAFIPPLDLQKQFDNFVSQIDKSKSVIQKSLDETQLLFDSLMQQYFG